MSDFEIDILIDEQRWTESFELIDALASRCVHATIAYLKTASLPLKVFSEGSLALVNDAKIQDLNAQYRHKNKPTNVLSFPAMEIDGFAPILGDIVLSYETVIGEAKARSLPPNDHVAHLIIHGFLHLQGYDHENDSDADIMETIEIKTLEGLGIANPYVKGELL